MEMLVTCTSFGVKIPLKILNLGVTAANSVIIKFKQGPVIRTFYMAKFISFKGDGSLGFTLAGSKWFKVKDPDKHVLIKDFENKLVDFSIAATCGAGIDMTMTIYDENMQPWYEIKRVKIPPPDMSFSVSTTEFTLRATLLKDSITYNGDKVDYVGKIAQP